MNIAYDGFFLKEGLLSLGHTVIDMAPYQEKDVTDALAELDMPVDVVLVELFGAKKLPAGLHRCQARLAAYCIDSSINAFWLEHACKVFDDVFVDQMETVSTLRKAGIRASWLPLCAQKHEFRAPTPCKKYDISFVGVTTPQRLKRSNILNLLMQRYSVHIRQDVDNREMIDIFSESRIVLNENLFDGLTLRVFQALASGGLLLTEARGRGTQQHFTDGRHLVCYTPQTLLPLADRILKQPEAYAPIALAGQNLCRKNHTSEARAAQMLSALENNSARTARRDGAERHCGEAKAHCLRCLRFGGHASQAVQNLKQAAIQAQSGLPHQTRFAAEALRTLADMNMRLGRAASAKEIYHAARQAGDVVLADLKLGMALLAEHEVAQAKAAVMQAVANMPKARLLRHRHILPLLAAARTGADMLLVMAHIFNALGRRMVSGFWKQIPDPCPDTAMELAYMSWNLSHSPESMDLLLETAGDLAGELLPELLDAVRKGLLEDRHITHTAALAESYYASEAATQLLSGLKCRRQMEASRPAPGNGVG